MEATPKICKRSGNLLREQNCGHNDRKLKARLIGGGTLLAGSPADFRQGSPTTPRRRKVIGAANIKAQ